MSSILKKLYNNSVYKSYPTISSIQWPGHPEPKLPELLEQKQPYKHDILVLSCANWRLEKETKKSYGLTSTNVESAINETDILHAATIREYYGKKIVVLRLLDKKISTFRTNLASFLSSNGYNVSADHVGIAYRLPQFHEYDLAVDSMRAERFNKKILKHSNEKSTKILVPIVQLSKKIRGTKLVDYWFEDTSEGHPVKLVLKQDNPLIQLWDEIFSRAKDQSKMIDLKANFRYSVFDDFHHLTIDNFELNTETLANIFCG